MNALRPVLAIFSVLACLVLSGTARAAPSSHFPADGLERFLFERFDLATVRSSLGPRRTPATRTLADLGLVPTKDGGGILEFDEGDWFRQLRIVGRGDANKDGIEDLEVCFTDEGRQGATYRAQQSLLVTRYTDDGYAVALNFASDACERMAAADTAAARARRGVPDASLRAIGDEPSYVRVGRFIYAFHRTGMSVATLDAVDTAAGAPPALAARAHGLARRFEAIVRAYGTVGVDEMEAALREAAIVSGLIAEWHGGAGRQAAAAR